MAYTDIDDPSDYFETKLYTGTGSEQSITMDFAPNWVWLKRRDGTGSHRLFDSVRGATKEIYTDGTNAEATEAQTLKSFNSNGFTLGTEGATNGSSRTFATWNWKAGTSVSGNTGGSGTAKTYTGSVNTDAGFSIIRYIGNGSAGHTIPHHLGTTPAWVIARTISAEKEWDVYHHKNTSSPETDYLVLNTTAATSDSNDKWNDTAPTSSVVTLGDSSQLNTNDGTCIMYAFAEKKGYSKFGSYVGNGNANGPYLYTGFKPAFIILKRTDSTNNWHLADNKRLNPYNPTSAQMYPNLANAEAEQADLDILSNGFKPRQAHAFMNASGGAYIYMAFAENPFVTSTGVPATAR